MIDRIGLAAENRRGPDLDAHAFQRRAVAGPQHLAPHEEPGAEPIHHRCVRPVVVAAPAHGEGRSKPGRGRRGRDEAERPGKKRRPGDAGRRREKGATAEGFVRSCRVSALQRVTSSRDPSGPMRRRILSPAGERTTHARRLHGQPIGANHRCVNAWAPMDAAHLREGYEPLLRFVPEHKTNASEALQKCQATDRPQLGKIPHDLR